MDGLSFIKFTLIALSLPAQYYISQYWSNDSIQQNLAFINLVDTLSDIKTNYLELESWKKWYINLVIDLPKAYKAGVVVKRKSNGGAANTAKRSSYNIIDYDDVMAVEVFAFRQNLVNFAESSIVRTPRPDSIQYRIGQVVKHKKYDLYGVIIGWDETANAPDSWINRNYSENKEKYTTQPHYLVLVDEKNQNKFRSKAYIAQEEVEIVTDFQIQHRSISSYFAGFDGTQYVPKKYLKTVYPHD